MSRRYAEVVSSGKETAVLYVGIDLHRRTSHVAAFDEEGLLRLLRLARIGCTDIFAAQLKATGR